MFENIGSKIQKAASGIFTILIVIVIIASIVLLGVLGQIFDGFGYVFIVLLGAVAGIIIAWLSVLCLYGFGKLIETTEYQTAIMAKLLKGQNNDDIYSEAIEEEVLSINKDYFIKEPNSKTKTCIKCGREIEIDALFCENCGQRQ